MGRFNNSFAMIGFLLSIAASIACNLSLVPPQIVATQPPVTPTVNTITHVAVLPTTTPLPTNTPNATAIPSTTVKPSATPQPAKIIYVVVTSTATQPSTAKPKAVSVQASTSTPQHPTVAGQNVAAASPVPSATPIPPTATSRPDVVWAVFPFNNGADYAANAIYQPFEHGFMLWRSDYNCAYAVLDNHSAVIPLAMPDDPKTVRGYRYCLSLAPLTDRSISANPPAGSVEPTGTIGKVWHYYAEVRDKLGYATAAEQSYPATVPNSSQQSAESGLVSYTPQITLPDGQVLACGSRSATSGTCELSSR